MFLFFIWLNIDGLVYLSWNSVTNFLIKTTTPSWLYNDGQKKCVTSLDRWMITNVTLNNILELILGIAHWFFFQGILRVNSLFYQRLNVQQNSKKQNTKMMQLAVISTVIIFQIFSSCIHRSIFVNQSKKRLCNWELTL